MKYLILAIALMMQGCVMLDEIGQPSDFRYNYEMERNKDLILQHGAGGCTPNFSTGGCL